MLDRIHYSKIKEIVERRKDGRPIGFSLQFCKKSTGELMNYPQCVLTSWHSTGGTMNVLIAGESQPRKIRRCLITKINDIKIYY